jgi:hypothetical protein
MRVTRPVLSFTGIQIKSEECFHRLARAVQEIEEQVGIHQVKIELKNIFFCPWIDTEKCKETPMEKLLIGLIEKLESK